MKIQTTVSTVDEIKKIMDAQADRPKYVRVFVAGYG
jgi:hypothetical protein